LDLRDIMHKVCRRTAEANPAPLPLRRTWLPPRPVHHQLVVHLHPRLCRHRIWSDLSHLHPDPPIRRLSHKIKPKARLLSVEDDIVRSGLSVSSHAAAHRRRGLLFELPQRLERLYYQQAVCRNYANPIAEPA
jgi:hypothetical protein